MDRPAPATAEELLARVAAQYAGLSRQLKDIGRYVETHRERLAIEGIQQVAAACDVQPSAVVRFAQHFGLSGYVELQKLFRAAISEQIAPARNHEARIREAVAAGPLAPIDIAHQLLEGSIAGLQELLRSLDRSDFDAAVQRLAEADTIWLVGMRRSFPVAAYLAYALQHTDKRVVLLDGTGAMQQHQGRSIRRGDALVAVSFVPYAPETLGLAESARERGATVVALTDSRLGPVAATADAVLTVQQAELFGFRTLSSTMCLAQALYIAVAYRLEKR